VAAVQATHASWVILDIPCVNPEAAWAAALSQVGKSYDWLALTGFLVHRNWESQDRWFCSELVAWSFAQAGSPLFRAETKNLITPRDFWILPEAIVAFAH
jgi:uncharacterized protein YycO